MNRTSNGKLILIGISVAVLLATLLSSPIWLQNRYLILMSEKAKLTREVAILKGEVQKKALHNQELSSLPRIAEVAGLHGISLKNVPLKVMAVGGNP